MRGFGYHAPRTLAEAIALLERYEGRARPLAGGTDLLLAIRRGAVTPAALVNLKKVPGLTGIEREGESLRLGALTTVEHLAGSRLLDGVAEVVSAAATSMAATQVRNLATAGGNLCNASPAADLAPPLVALDAEVEIAGPAGRRRMPVEALFAGPRENALGPAEILTAILVRNDSRRRARFRKFEFREAMDVAVASVAVALELDGDGRVVEPRIALGAVAPTPIRAREAEAILAGNRLEPDLAARAARAAAEAARPIDDVRASAVYRRRLVRVLCERLLASLSPEDSRR